MVASGHSGAGGQVEEELYGGGACARFGQWASRMRPHEQVRQAAAGFHRPEDGQPAGARRQGARRRTSRILTRRARACRAGSIRCRIFWRAIAFARWWRRCRRRALNSRAIIWGMGGHVIKCGLAPVLLDLMRPRLRDHVRAERLGRDPRFRNRAGRSHQRRCGSRAARWPVRRGRGDRTRDEPAIAEGDRDGLGHR